MNISQISEKMSNFITKDLDYSEEKKEVVTYAIETGFLSLLGFTVILIGGYFFDALIPAAIAAVFGGLLRRVSGGAHFNTPIKCLAFGAIIYTLIGVFSKKIIDLSNINNNILLLILLASLLLVAILSPVDCEAKPIHSKSLRRKLKMASIGIVIVTIIIVYFSSNNIIKVSAVMGIVYQSITLLPVLNKRMGRCNII